MYSPSDFDRILRKARAGVASDGKSEQKTPAPPPFDPSLIPPAQQKSAPAKGTPPAPRAPATPPPAPQAEPPINQAEAARMLSGLDDGSGNEPESGAVSAEVRAMAQELLRTGLSPRHQVEAWLALMVKSGASDLILRAGGRPSTRIDGRVGFLPGRVPNAGAMMEILEGVLGPDRMQVWRTNGSADAALQLDGLGRFRLNAYKQMGEPALVVRRVSEQAPELVNLNLPLQELSRVALKKRGLVLVTGVAGSGKSTTLSAMIQFMNANAERHVITLEDPVEVLFRELRCVISQREVGVDCTDFQDGLRHALRQSPDVILIGEMRDKATVEAALDASETGHLVLSTLHTVNAPQTIDRILGFYPVERHPQVRARLSENLACVLSQRLLPRAGGKGLVPAYELMTWTPHIAELLAEGKTGQITRVIETAGSRSLVSFNQSLRLLVQGKLVELKDALAASDKPDELILALRGITTSSARETRGIQYGDPDAPGSTPSTGGGATRGSTGAPPSSGPPIPRG